MQPYITFREADQFGKLQYYILQRAFPHYIGQLVEYPSNIIVQSIPIAGYSLWLSYTGTIRGKVVPAYSDYQMELQLELENMARWFGSERIHKNPDKYKKFKINVQSTH
jgi:hypothetical protein